MAGYWYECWVTVIYSELYIFERKRNTPRGQLIQRLEIFSSKIAEVGRSTEHRCEFVIRLKDNYTHWFYARSKQEMDVWISKLNEARSYTPPPKRLLNLDLRPIKHLILSVHGIGSHKESFERHTLDFKSALDFIAETIYPDIDFSYKIVPCRWREGLQQLDVEREMEMIKLKSGDSSIRSFLLDKGIDIMYYMKDNIRSVIHKEIVTSFNETYQGFMEEYPYFDGLVTVLAHSLGGVISYNILTDQYHRSPQDLNEHGLSLDFTPENLFLIGSPLGPFVVMEAETLKPRFDRAYPFRVWNIFHPYDPVSFRLEPIFQPSDKLKEPVIIPHYKTMKERQSTVKWISSLLSFPTETRSSTHASSDAAIGFDPTSPVPPVPHVISAATASLEGAKNTVQAVAAVAAVAEDLIVDDPAAQAPSERSEVSSGRGSIPSSPSDDSMFSSKDMELYEYDGVITDPHDSKFVASKNLRMDFILQETAMEEVSTSMFNALKAHGGYWNSYDTALMIIGQLLKAEAKTGKSTRSRTTVHVPSIHPSTPKTPKSAV